MPIYPYFFHGSSYIEMQPPRMTWIKRPQQSNNHIVEWSSIIDIDRNDRKTTNFSNQNRTILQKTSISRQKIEKMKGRQMYKIISSIYPYNSLWTKISKSYIFWGPNSCAKLKQFHQIGATKRLGDMINLRTQPTIRIPRSTAKTSCIRCTNLCDYHWLRGTV